MKTIYMIVTGSYSDYHVVGTSTDHALAEQLCEKLNVIHGDNSFRAYDVEARPLFESTDDMAFSVQYRVDIDFTGAEEHRWSNITNLWEEEEPSDTEHDAVNVQASRITALSRRGYDVA